MTLSQHEELMEEVEQYADVDPADLLEENRHLLETDFGVLGKGAAVDRKFWVAEMDAAIAPAAHVARGRGSTQTLHSRFCQGTQYVTRCYSIPPRVQTEGSMIWRRRRRHQ